MFLLIPETLPPRQPNGDLLYGLYLVDILCLGVKNILCEADVSRSRYRSNLLDRMYGNEEPIPCSRELAHQVIYGAIMFAHQYGFRPHRDFELSQYILDGLDSVGPSADIEFGRDGKPLHIGGPHDDFRRTLRQLEAAAGSGNYDYVLEAGSPIPRLRWVSGRRCAKPTGQTGRQPNNIQAKTDPETFPYERAGGG